MRRFAMYGVAALSMLAVTALPSAGRQEIRPVSISYDLNENRDAIYAAFLQPEVIPSPRPPPAPMSVPAGIANITYYFCEQEEGYPMGDGGGYCGTIALGRPVRPGDSGYVAACGANWDSRTMLRIGGYEKDITCLDWSPHLGPSQIDVFFWTNGDYYRSNLSNIRQANVYVLEPASLH